MHIPINYQTHLGSLVVAKGMWYYFNILNEDGDLGSYFNPKMDTWEALSKTNYTYIPENEHAEVFLHEQPIVTVPFLG